MKKITNECPYCGEILKVERMRCGSCEVEIAAEFPQTRLGNLPLEHQRFIEMFVLAAGNLKEIASHTGVSYPTVRSRLQKVIDALRDEISLTAPTRGTLLDALAPEGPPGQKKHKPTDADIESAGRLIKSI